MNKDNSGCPVGNGIYKYFTWMDNAKVYSPFKNFSFLNIDTLIFTKFDETKVFGTIFSLIYDTDRPVSYFSIGQEVPDDIVPASSDFLVECILEGFEKKRGEHGNASK